MAGDGTKYQIDIDVPASGAEFAAAAVARLGDKLTGAQSAAAKAAEAVKASEAAYNAAEISANKAATALEKIGLAVEAQPSKVAAAVEKYGLFSKQAQAAAEKLNQLNARQAEASAKAAAATAAMNEAASATDTLRASSATAASAQERYSTSLDKAKASAAALAKAEQAAKASQAAQLAASEKAATAKAAEAQKLREAASAADKAAKGNGNLGKAASELGNLGGPLGAVSSKVLGLVDSFGDMKESLGSGGVYAAIAVGIVAIATAVAAVTAAALAGIGTILAWAVKLADTDGVIAQLTDRTKKNFAKIFGGLNIKPLLKELGQVARLFDEGSASAKAIKVVFNSLFQPILDGVTAFIPKMVSAFIQFEILVLKALIAIKPFGSTIMLVAKIFGVVALVITGVLALAIGILIAGVAAMAVGFGVFLAIIGAVIFGLGWLVSKVVGAGAAIISGIGAAIDWLRSMSLSEIGSALIQGLIDGLMAAGGGVLKAITGVVGGAIDGAKSLLGIASPSKVFAEIGGHTAEGMAQGVDDGAASVQGSLESMVSPPAAGTAASGSTSTSTSTGATYHITITEAGFGIDALRSLLSDLGAQAGTAVPSAA